MKKNLNVRINSALIQIFGSETNGRIWLNTPNPELDNVSPNYLINIGRGDIVAELLEDILLGHPK